VNFAGVAQQILEKIKNGDENILQTVTFKRKGVSYYYSTIRQKLVHVNRQAEFYLLPVKKDDRGNLLILTMGLFSSGEILLVPEDEIEIIGNN
jgi:hypothetical protein